MGHCNNDMTTRPPSAARIYKLLLDAAERQIATTTEGQAIAAAGFEQQLLDLAHKIAANAANPLADFFEDAMADAIPIPD